MRTKFLLMAILLVGTAGCDQQQSQILSMRDAFDKELKAKDKVIEDLNRKVNDLDQRNGQMEQQLIKASGGSDKVVAAVTEGVSKAVVDQNTTTFNQVKSQLDEILKTLKSGVGVAPSAPSAQGPVANAPQQQYQAPPPQPTQRPASSEPRDPNTKKYKMTW